MFSRDVNIQTSKVWFHSILKLMGILIFSLLLNLSLTTSYFIIERVVMMIHEDSLSFSVIYFKYVGHIYTRLIGVMLCIVFLTWCYGKILQHCICKQQSPIQKNIGNIWFGMHLIDYGLLLERCIQ